MPTWMIYVIGEVANRSAPRESADHVEVTVANAMGLHGVLQRR